MTDLSIEQINSIKLVTKAVKNINSLRIPYRRFYATLITPKGKKVACNEFIRRVKQFAKDVYVSRPHIEMMCGSLERGDRGVWHYHLFTYADRLPMTQKNNCELVVKHKQVESFQGYTYYISKDPKGSLLYDRRDGGTVLFNNDAIENSDQTRLEDFEKFLNI